MFRSGSRSHVHTHRTTCITTFNHCAKSVLLHPTPRKWHWLSTNWTSQKYRDLHWLFPPHSVPKSNHLGTLHESPQSPVSLFTSSPSLALMEAITISHLDFCNWFPHSHSCFLIVYCARCSQTIFQGTNLTMPFKWTHLIISLYLPVNWVSSFLVWYTSPTQYI